MKIIMAMVMSLDAKTTKHFDSNVYKWTSVEDQKQFFSLIAKQKIIIMGSRTYEAVKDYIKLTPKTLRIILTSYPEKYNNKTVSGQLEFKNITPTKLVIDLEKKGFKKALLVGGSTLNSSFLLNNLVDEIWLTVEPRIFGKGNLLIAENELNIDLELITIKRLNKKGTLLIKYKVIK